MRSVLAVLALIVGLSIASLTPAAQAEEARAAQKTYMAKIQEGIAQVRSEAYDQALSTFREAKEAEPQRAEAIYYEAGLESDAGQAYDDAVARLLGEERPHRFVDEEKRGLFKRIFGGKK